MCALRIREDATVEGGAAGAKDIVQCMWGAVQVGAAGARV